MKKKSIIFGLALAGAMIVASCGGNKKAEDTGNADAEFEVAQPVASGEYRAVSFQYDEPESSRMPFDGRILFALDKENSGIYVYENGNRTHFKAVISLPAPFSKTDSIYTATDSKDRQVAFIPGAEVDTLVITKENKPVKIAFERKPVSEMTATEAMTRITTLLSK